MKSTFRNMSILSAAVVAALGASSALAGGRPDLVLAALQNGNAQFSPGELLVQFSPSASEFDRRAVRQGLGAQREEIVRGARGGDGQLELLRLPPGLAIADAVRGLDGVNGVDFAEPNWTYFHNAVSNDPLVTNGSLWGMTGSFGSQASVAWANTSLGKDRTDCSSVVVGIIDEGYMHAHPDLSDNAFRNPQEGTGVAGVDDDGNGLVDDIYGWDFDGGNNSVFDGAGDDHGTHVAGTIGGEGGNGIGVAGVCWSVKLMNAKFLGRRGGSTANAIKAVDYFTDLKIDQGLNIVATNNSWGGGGFSSALQSAIGRAETAGILFIAAAGNSGANNDVTASYPSNYPNANIIAVAALTSSGALASYSQYGATTVDLGAPGSAITSTVPVSSKGNVVPGYASYSGTSMATPHVTGAAAMYKAQNPTASAADIKAAILTNGTATPSLNGKTVTGKRLNVSGF